MAEEIFEKRLYIGGLFDGVTEDQIKDRFKPYGHVKSVQLVKKENKNGLTSTVLPSFPTIIVQLL